MTDCAHLVKCPFFNDRMQSMPATADIYKKRYCRGDFNNCARFKVSKALGKENVPADLFPNQDERAKEIISDG
ncbi:MAG: hypothetical protein AB7T10_07910 [bacterium]